jgi:hypothetical protein
MKEVESQIMWWADLAMAIAFFVIATQLMLFVRNPKVTTYNTSLNCGSADV